MSAATGAKGVRWPSNNASLNNAGIAASKGVPERPSRLAAPVAKMTTEYAATLRNNTRNASATRALEKAATMRAFVNSNTHDPANIEEERESREREATMELLRAEHRAAAEAAAASIGAAAAGAATGAATSAKPRGPGKRGSRRSSRRSSSRRNRK